MLKLLKLFSKGYQLKLKLTNLKFAKPNNLCFLLFSRVLGIGRGINGPFKPISWIYKIIYYHYP